jgi:hypothetical protein
MTDDDPTPADARAALDRAIGARPGNVVAFLDRLNEANDLLDDPHRHRARRRLRYRR